MLDKTHSLHSALAITGLCRTPPYNHLKEGNFTNCVCAVERPTTLGKVNALLLSGLSYQAGGLPLCLATAGAVALAAWLAARRLEAGEP